MRGGGITSLSDLLLAEDCGLFSQTGIHWTWLNVAKLFMEHYVYTCSFFCCKWTTGLGWKPLENRRAVSRLALLYKSIHYTVAINTDEHLTSQADNKIHTRKSCEISFTHPTVKKDCYKHSFLPRTMTEWNLLPPDIRQSTSVDSL